MNASWKGQEGDSWPETSGGRDSPWSSYEGIPRTVRTGGIQAEIVKDDMNLQPTKKVFVGRLDIKTGRSRVMEFFSRFGKVIDIKMPVNDDGRSKGYCFITFDAMDVAKWVVIDNYKNNYIDGRWVDCKFDRSRSVVSHAAQANTDGHESRWWESRATTSTWWDTSAWSGGNWNSSHVPEAWPSNPTRAELQQEVPADKVCEEELAWRERTSPMPTAVADHPLPAFQDQEHDVWPEACPRQPAAATSELPAASASTALVVRPEGLTPLSLQNRQPRVFLLDPEEGITSAPLLAVLVPDESIEVCQSASYIAMKIVCCTPGQDIHEEMFLLDQRRSWLEQTIATVGAELLDFNTSRFHLASVLKGPFKGWMAVGVGSNSKRLKRACYLSLAASIVVSSHQCTLSSVQNQAFALICEHALSHRTALFPSCPAPSASAQQAHASSAELVFEIQLGLNVLNDAVGSRAELPRARFTELHMVLQDRAGCAVQTSLPFSEWPLPDITEYLLDGLYVLKVSGDVVDLRVADPNFWCAIKPCVVEADIDPGSFVIRNLEPGELCKQAYRAAVLSQVGDEDATVLRARIEPQGWVTLAEWFTQEDGSGNVLQSAFLARCQETEWGPPAEEALQLDYLRHLAVEASAIFELRQSDLRELVSTAMRESEHGPTSLFESAELSLRDEARKTALERYHDYIEGAIATGVLERQSSRRGSCDREHQAKEGVEQQRKLEKGAALVAREELLLLSQTRDRAKEARKVARRAECDLLDAYDDGDSADIADKEKAWRKMRSLAQKADIAFQKKISYLSRMCEHLPEVQPEILAMTNDHVKKELLAMKPLDQSRVIDLLAMERSLKHYDQQYDKMNKLSRDGARHKVLAASYDGQACVLKIFELSNPTSVAAFLKEVRLHRKLNHAYVAKLQLAFTDSTSSHGVLGILHFDKYECDLERWGETRLQKSTNPCVTVKNLCCKMVQSIAYIHSMGIVHGDIKPSNWVVDAGTETTRLIDFETAKDRGIGGVTATRAQTTAGPQLRTRGYVAPELEADETRPKSRASDIYALGMSLQFLIECISLLGSASCASSRDLKPLTNLVAQMICRDPADRISAQHALNDAAFAIAGSAPPIVSPGAAPVYWACRGQYEWHRSEFMERECMRLLHQTTCSECRFWGLATNVRIIKICRVENLIHWKSFSGRRAELKERNQTLTHVANRNLIVGDIQLDDTTSEVFLWHGLPAANVPMVANSGLDERIANCKGLYGAGIYLTDQWCKALQYSRAGRCSIRHKQCGQKYRCSCVGPKRVLLCRALLGEAYYVRPEDNLKGQRRPPPRTDAGPGVVYDSIIAEPMYMRAFNRRQHHREHVLFDRKSVYPEWIIELDWDV